MFTLPISQDERIEQFLGGRVCTAPDGSYIRRSVGRRKSGREPKYLVHLASGRSFAVTASSDERAVEKANLLIEIGQRLEMAAKDAQYRADRQTMEDESHFSRYGW